MLMKRLFYLLVVFLCMACGKSRIPDGYYHNKDATAFTCRYFQVKGDTLIWCNDFRKPSKAFKYELSGGEIRAKCLTEDERLIKKYKFVDDSIIVEKEMFVPFNPNVNKVAEGHYENYLSVPLKTLNVRIYGDSMEMKYYRYDELLRTTRSRIYVKDSRTLVVISKDTIKNESVFMNLSDGFMLDEERFVRTD